MKHGTGPDEYMHESIKADAVCYDLPTEEIIEGLCKDNSNLQSELDKYRWIPVSERSPEKDGFYEVIITGGNLPTSQEYIFAEKRWDCLVSITHWRSITLPKGK